MIDRILQPFDFILKMPIQEQCLHAVGVSFTGFLIAAILRESCKDQRVRYAARALGAGAFIMVSVYAMVVTDKYVKLDSEYKTVKARKSSGVSADEVVTLTTSYGDKFEFGRTDSGLRIRTAGSGCGVSSNQCGECDKRRCIQRMAASRLGISGRADAVDDGVHAVMELPEWYRWLSGDAFSGRNERCFQFKEEASGENF